MVVPHHSVGAEVGVAQVEDKKGPIVTERQKPRHDVDVIPVRRVSSERRRRHGHDSVGDVREIQIERMLLVPALVLRDLRAQLLPHLPAQPLCLAQVYQHTQNTQPHGNARDDAQRCGGGLGGAEVGGVARARLLHSYLDEKYDNRRPHNNKVEAVPHVPPEAMPLRHDAQHNLDHEAAHDGNSEPKEDRVGSLAVLKLSS
mmetsp:Transcript_6326/g.15958  ORF Transcript_6326/g.15958 Transcript_6326/m.15958 type:complete len:201 (-) Transcript_6326:260-862(-)